MNLNFHIVSIRSDFSKPQEMDQNAKLALADDVSTVEAVLALAELVDWEESSHAPRTVLGLRCAATLKALVSRPAGRALIASAATASPGLQDLLVRYGAPTKLSRAA